MQNSSRSSSTETSGESPRHSSMRQEASCIVELDEVPQGLFDRERRLRVEQVVGAALQLMLAFVRIFASSAGKRSVLNAM